MPMERVFIDWCEPALPSTANYLCSRYGAGRLLDLQHVIIALPGGRAGRRLLEILVDVAQSQQTALMPPRLITVGQLPELLYDAQQPFANALTQQLAWAEALRRTDTGEREHLTRHLPDPDDILAQLTFVERLMTLHRDLAGDRFLFADVAACDTAALSPQERTRWQALAAVQSRYMNILQDLGFWEAQQARLWAISQRACHTACDIILAGAVDLNAAQRAMLDQVANRVTALVFAPEALAERFDAYGCVKRQAWLEAHIDLGAANIVFSDGPGDQASEVVNALAGLHGAFASDDITIGVPDPRLVPHIQQRLEDHHLPFRYGAGVPVTQSSPYRLLRGIADCLDSQAFTAFSNLARHPAIDHWLKTQGIAGHWLQELDDYYHMHLPARLTGQWLTGRRPRAELRRAHSAIGHLLTPLRGAARPPQLWQGPILELLIQVYGEMSHSRDDDDQRLTLAACEAMQTAMRDTFQVPEAVAPRISGAAAIRLLLRTLQDMTIPPRADPAAIELLGWLELPLDDAPAVIVTGFNEGYVPESQNGDLFLPDTLRRELGLPDNAQRYARDAYHLSLLAAPRASLTLITGRRTLDNDVLLPSRLLFACRDDHLLARTDAAFSAPGRHPRPISASTLRPGRTQAQFGCSCPDSLRTAITSMRVTEFRDYLVCPYRYYLKHHLSLRAVDTTAEELGPPAFGDLLHQVLQAFAASPAAQSERVTELRDLLYSTLDELVVQSFGDASLPAVRVQVEQARARLERFAIWQADWTRQGWRIEHVEVDIGGAQAGFDVGGEPMYLRGRMDRIDVHDATQRRIVFDYKTGETARKPEAVHRNRQGEWIDLQLPLYRHLAKGLDLGDPLELGYIMLPKTLSDVGASIATWSTDDLAQADAVAVHVASQVRAQRFWPPAAVSHAYDEYAVLCHPMPIDRIDAATPVREA